ncbi:MAG: hypothetical protein AAF446_08975, partial [Pseudomonadota bacterium]
MAEHAQFRTGDGNQHLRERMPRGAEYSFETSTERSMAPSTTLNTFELRFPENAARHRTATDAVSRA